MNFEKMPNKEGERAKSRKMLRKTRAMKKPRENWLKWRLMREQKFTRKLKI